MPQLTQQRRNSPIEKLHKYIRSLDIYGHPINLRFKNSNTFKSTLGGIFTIISRIVILIYFIVEIRKVIDKSSTITNTDKIINTSISPIQYDLDLSKFDFAVRLRYALDTQDPDVNLNMQKYAYVTIETVKFSVVPINETLTQIVNATEIELVKCPSGRFGGEKEITSSMKIEETFSCPKNTNFPLKGGWGATSQSQLTINVRKCKQSYLDKNYPGQKCKNNTEIDRIFENLSVLVPIMNQFFDQDDFSGNPIKNAIYILQFTTHPNLGQTYNYKTSQNNLIIRDSWFSHSLGEKSLPFYKTRFDQQFIQLSNDRNSNPITVNLLMDENVKTTVREVYSIGDALASAGGFLGIIVIVVQTLISNFQEHLFYQSIIKKTFISEDNQQSKHKLDKKSSQLTNKVSTIKSSMINGQESKRDDNGVESIFEQLFQSLCRRHHFIFTLKDYLHGTYFRCCCRKSIQRKFNTYKNGVKKLKKELDITTLLKKIRSSNFATQIILSKYQKALMPYFHINIISEIKQSQNDKLKDVLGPSLNNGLQEDKKKLIKQYLMQAIIQGEKLKVDQRLLKNLDPRLKERVSSNPLVNATSKNISEFLIRDMNNIINQTKPQTDSNQDDNGLKDEAFETKQKLNTEEIDLDKEINDFEQCRINQIGYF